MSEQTVKKVKLNLIAVNPFSYSLGLAYLEANVLDKLGGKVDVESKIYNNDRTGDYYFDHSLFIKKITANKPDVIGFSTYMWNERFIKQISGLVSRLFPDILLVFGGPQFLRHNPEWEGYPEKALFVLGEGEETIVEIVEAYMENRPFTGIQGTAYRDNRDKNKWVIHERETFINLDTLVSPVLTGTLQHKPKPLYWIPSYSTSRGCKYSCSFCNWGDKKGVRFFPLDRVFKELENLKKLKEGRLIWFTDCIWGVDEERYIKILEYLADWPDDFSFGFETSPQFMTPGMLEAFSKVSIAWLSFGVQSMNARTLENINRDDNSNKLFEAVDSLLDRVVDDPKKIHLDLIFGLPGDRVEDTIHTINLIKETYFDTYLHFEVLKILPGSALKQTASQSDMIYHGSTQAYDLIASREYSFDDLILMKKIGFGVEFMQMNSAKEWVKSILKKNGSKKGGKKYTHIALGIAEFLDSKDLGWHVEYERPFWLERQLDEYKGDIYKDLEDYLGGL